MTEKLVELIPLTVDSAASLVFFFFCCVLSDEISINIYTLYICILGPACGFPLGVISGQSDYF